MPPGPVHSGPRPVIGEATVWACALRIAAGDAIPRSAAPVPTSVPPTKSRRVTESGGNSGEPWAILSLMRLPPNPGSVPHRARHVHHQLQLGALGVRRDRVAGRGRCESALRTEREALEVHVA